MTHGCRQVADASQRSGYQSQAHRSRHPQAWLDGGSYPARGNGGHGRDHQRQGAPALKAFQNVVGADAAEVYRKPVDAITGLTIAAEQIDDLYRRTGFGDRLLLPDRVLAMRGDLFKYLKSPIGFFQMGGRGMRIDAPTGKLMFHVCDDTDATRLSGEDFITEPTKPREGPGPERPIPPPPPPISVGGFDVHITDACRALHRRRRGRQGHARAAGGVQGSPGGTPGAGGPLAGGLAALRLAGEPRALLTETKTRMLAE